MVDNILATLAVVGLLAIYLAILDRQRQRLEVDHNRSISLWEAFWSH